MRILARSEGGATGYCNLDKGHDGPHRAVSADYEEVWLDPAQIEQMKTEAAIEAASIMRARRLAK